MDTYIKITDASCKYPDTHGRVLHDWTRDETMVCILWRKDYRNPFAFGSWVFKDNVKVTTRRKVNS